MIKKVQASIQVEIVSTSNEATGTYLDSLIYAMKAVTPPQGVRVNSVDVENIWVRDTATPEGVVTPRQ